MNDCSTPRSGVDLLVVGGGINGVGIARDAAGRGLSVVLCERDDLAAHTSSKSTKLIHGGLRYLEHLQLGLVRESLAEREVLLRTAPHIVWPLRFVLPHHRSRRPVWMIRLGLWLYDRLGGGGALPRSAVVGLRRHPAGTVLKQHLRRGFEYSDCWVQDARLVVLAAMDAAERGATVMTRTELVAARPEAGHWCATLRSRANGEQRSIRCRAIVNAAGPWVGDVLAGRLGVNTDKRTRLVAGSHIVVPRLHNLDVGFIFQNADRRIVFALPYERHFTLIGTTERELDSVPEHLQASASDIDYLCRAVSEYLRQPVSPGEVVDAFCGTRALFDDASAQATKVTRDYVLEVDSRESLPVLSVFGGKLTTFRSLAETAVDTLCEVLGVNAPGWTAAAELPGGDLGTRSFEQFVDGMQTEYPWLPAEQAWRYARNYGSRSHTIIGKARSLGDLGACIARDLYVAELDYLVEHEWVREADDLLWRRTKLGLHLSIAERERVAGELRQRLDGSPGQTTGGSHVG